MPTPHTLRKMKTIGFKGPRICKMCKVIILPGEVAYRIGPSARYTFLCEEHKNAKGELTLHDDYLKAWAKVVRILKKAHKNPPSFWPETLLEITDYLVRMTRFFESQPTTPKTASIKKSAMLLVEYCMQVWDKYASQKITWRYARHLLYYVPSKCNFHVTKPKPKSTHKETPINAKFI